MLNFVKAAFEATMKNGPRAARALRDKWRRVRRGDVKDEELVHSVEVGHKGFKALKKLMTKEEEGEEAASAKAKAAAAMKEEEAEKMCAMSDPFSGGI